MNANPPSSERSEADLLKNLLEELSTEQGRSLVILSASYLDFLLEELIVAGLPVSVSQNDRKSLFDGDRAPLGTFSSRILMAYCLGLIDRSTKNDLDRIRKVRNAFAHQIRGVSFESEEIASLCGYLEAAQTRGTQSSAEERLRAASVRIMVDIMIQKGNLLTTRQREQA